MNITAAPYAFGVSSQKICQRLQTGRALLLTQDQVGLVVELLVVMGCRVVTG